LVAVAAEFDYFLLVILVARGFFSIAAALRRVNCNETIIIFELVLAQLALGSELGLLKTIGLHLLSGLNHGFLQSSHFVSACFIDEFLDKFASFFVPILEHDLLRLASLHKILELLLLRLRLSNFLLHRSFFNLLLLFLRHRLLLDCQRFKHRVRAVQEPDLFLCQSFARGFWQRAPLL